jgi:ribosomal protein L19
MWRLCASNRKPEDIDGQIREIFSQITADVGVWQSITKQYRVNLFCGLFMSETNDGLSISPQSLAVLAERGIELWFDIYAPTDDEHETST